MLKLFGFLFPLFAAHVGIGEDGGGDAGASGSGDGAGGADDKSGAGGSGAGSDDGAGADGGADGDLDAPKPGSVEGAAAAIKAGLAGEADPGEKPKPAAAKAEPTEDEKKRIAEDAAAANDPVKKQELQDAREKVELDKTRSMKSDDFKLTDADRKVLKPDAQKRFHQLTTALKAREDDLAAINTQAVGYKTQSEALTNLLAETQTGPQELGALLDYNFMLKTGKFEQALTVINAHREAILKALGREEAGVDLLAEFPDLKEKVQTQDMDRAAALEVAKTRRTEQVRAQQDQQNNNRQQQQTNAEQASNNALTEIDKWCLQLSKTDIDYKAREAKLQPMITEVITKYRPDQWLPTLKMLYQNVVIEKGGNGDLPGAGQTLRPSGGTRPGAKAPSSMFDAIKQGLHPGTTA